MRKNEITTLLISGPNRKKPEHRYKIPAHPYVRNSTMSDLVEITFKRKLATPNVNIDIKIRENMILTNDSPISNFKI